ncbi:MAG TPA: GPW/gp25 family protein [Phycisphaerae bacterium]|nr:GPW/gp25 family protein [Phycisphaerae bacterium]
MNIAFPYQFNTFYRTAEATDDQHIIDLLEQLLFTSPGERVNRPSFGSGLLQILFGPTSPELAAATQLMMQGAIQQYMGSLIHVDSIDVVSEEATVQVTVRYLNRRTQQRQIAQLTRSAP